MPNVSPKKLKMMALYRLFLEKTDEEHGLTLPQILELLQKEGIEAERKSLYDDMETLRSCGVNIGMRKGKNFEYFLQSRDISFEELRLVARAVTTYPEFSKRKAKGLIGKLQSLCSEYQKDGLISEFESVQNSTPSKAEGLEEGMAIKQALFRGNQLEFFYFEWTYSRVTENLEKQYRRDGKALTVNPLSLISYDGNEYLLALEEERLRHFRVGNMEKSRVLEEKAITVKPASVEKYKKKVFQAFEPEAGRLELEFEEELLGDVVCHFGSSLSIMPTGKGLLRVEVETEFNACLYGFLFGLGARARILSPKKAAEVLREKAKTISKMYKADKKGTSQKE